MFVVAGDCGEGPPSPHRRPGQEEVPGPLRPDRGPVLLPDPQEDPPQTRGRTLLFRQQCHPTHQRHHGGTLPGDLTFVRGISNTKSTKKHCFYLLY